MKLLLLLPLLLFLAFFVPDISFVVGVPVVVTSAIAVAAIVPEPAVGACVVAVVVSAPITILVLAVVAVVEVVSVTVTVDVSVFPLFCYSASILSFFVLAPATLVIHFLLLL